MGDGNPGKATIDTLLDAVEADLFVEKHRPSPGYNPFATRSPGQDPITKGLIARYARLRTLWDMYLAKFASELSQSSFERQEAKTKAYRLAATDLFVETALDLLERKSVHYKLGGVLAYTLSVFAISGGILAAYSQAKPFEERQSGTAQFQSLVNQATTAMAAASQSTGVRGPVAAPRAPAASSAASSAGIASAPQPTQSTADGNESIVKHVLWLTLASAFARSFTFYGFIVLAAVTLWRLGRAMLDQSERLHDKRHALRQGRLFVHLKDGQVSADEMVVAFAWNIQQPNAFANMPTEAKAPWGGAFADLARPIADLSRASNEGAKQDRK